MEASEPADQDSDEPESKTRRKRRKPAAKPAESGCAKRSLNLRIDDETYERLTIHAMKRKTTISGLVMGLARDSLREFSVHRVGVRGEGQV